MNIIYLSQGSALKIFHSLHAHLHKKLSLKTTGIFVADRHFYNSYRKVNTSFNLSSFQFLKEWEIYRDYKNIVIDPTILDQYDWAPLIADRRITLGANTKYTQNYKPRFSRDEMLQITQLSIQRINAFIDSVKPDVIIGFNMVTLVEYLFYQIAQNQNIPYLQMKNAKIANYVMLVPDPLNLSTNLIKQAKSLAPNPTRHIIATEYLKSGQHKNSTYEGHVILKPPSLQSVFQPTLLQKATKALAFDILKIIDKSADYHSGGIVPFWHFNIRKPLLAHKQHKMLSKHYIKAKNLNKIKYIFFPLHTEPEIALSVYGRHFQNQIEVIRNIAQNLPLSWRLVIKDHPRSVGLRKTRYYRKLLEIPNVTLVNPYLPSYEIIDHCAAVVTISSWVGFEAVMSKKPVVTLGHCSFNALPDYMVKKCSSISNIGQDIADAIKNHRYDEDQLLLHIESILDMSFPINLYSDILEKPNRHQEISHLNRDITLKHFSNFIAKQVRDEIKNHEYIPSTNYEHIPTS